MEEGQAHAVAVSVETPSGAAAVRTRHSVSDQRAGAGADHATCDDSAGAPARNRGPDQRASPGADRAAGEGARLLRRLATRHRYRAGERQCKADRFHHVTG